MIWRALLCIVLVGLCYGNATAFEPASKRATPTLPSIALSDLPKEARDTLALIKRGGPYPYSKDGAVFGNRERLLPLKPRGHYREYTVKTPGAKNRGARRIVATKDGVSYYTADHYRTFRRILE